MDTHAFPLLNKAYNYIQIAEKASAHDELRYKIITVLKHDMPKAIFKVTSVKSYNCLILVVSKGSRFMALPFKKMKR